MAIPLYMDEHVPRSITIGLRLRDVDVLTAQEDSHNNIEDPVLLDRAGELGRASSRRTMTYLQKRAVVSSKASPFLASSTPTSCT
jgi:hypothetical protein